MAKTSPAADGVAAIVRDLERRLASAESKIVRPEAARSAYDRTAKGVIARQVLSGLSASFASATNSDFALAGVVVDDATRIYRVGLKSQFSPSLLSQWNIFLTADNGTTTVGVDRFWRWPTDSTQTFTIASTVFWTPDPGTYTLRVRQVLASGAGTIQYQANADVDDNAARRTFWVEDAGLRPA